MHALVRGAIFAAAISAAGALATRAPAPAPAASSSASIAAPGAAPPAPVEMPCPLRHIPEGAACVPLPAIDEPLEGPRELHRERRGRGATYELIPRRPDRPADPLAVTYPIDDPLFLRGFDDVPIAGASPASVELVAQRGAVVRAVGLEGQEGPTRVIAIGRLVGQTVVTAHNVTEGDRARTYLVFYGHLEASAPDLAVGTDLPPGTTLGYAGDSGNPGVVSLFVEARLLRDDVELAGLPIARLAEAATSIPCDLRNVLIER